MEEGRRVVRFGDSVVFDYAGYHLTAGRMTLDEAVGRAWAEGGVFLSGPGGSASASRVWLELATERFVLEDLQARLGPWSASAKRAELIGERIDLHHAHMTICPTPNPLYSLRARHLSRESQVRFVARGVVPYFYVVPFFYMPRYTYELEKAEDGDTLVPSRQGLEFNPGRGNFSGPFLKTTWRKKLFDRRLLSTLHLDYYAKPGPAIGEEIQYKSPSSEHLTFAFFTPQRNINRDNYSRAPGRQTRWRLWQTWTKKLPFGHFKSFVNEASDSHIDDDYRFNMDERRLREREISTELVFDRPTLRLKLLGERLKSLDVKGSREYRVERRKSPAVRFLTFPLLILRREPDTRHRGWKLYGMAEATGARGRDRVERADGPFGSGRLAGQLNVPLTSRLSSTAELSVQTDFHGEKIAGESNAATQIGGLRLTFHRPWLAERLQSDWGYSVQKAWTNKALFASGGEVENMLFLSLRNFRRVWKTSVDLGYDFRPGSSGMSTIDLQTRLGGADQRHHLSTIVRYLPQYHRAQSIYTSAGFKLGALFYSSLGFQTVHTDSELQVQFTPAFRFTSPAQKYRFGVSGFYDAKSDGWRTRDFQFTRAFDCIETTLRISKRDRDLQFSFSFNLTGIDKPNDLFNREGGRD